MRGMHEPYTGHGMSFVTGQAAFRYGCTRVTSALFADVQT